MAIQPAIIRTLAFFDLFNHPLTVWELRKLLYAPQSFDYLSVWKETAEIPEATCADGFCFLRRSDGLSLARQRAVREADNEMKIRRAQRAARLIGGVPFVRLAAICNTLSFSAAEEESDIDFLIVAETGRLWTVRFLITVVLSLFRLRRHGIKIKNRVCLSFYLTDQHLNLRSLAIPAAADIYLIYWIVQLVPLINREQTLEKFWQANFWVKEHLANFNFQDQALNSRLVKISSLAENWRRFWEKAGRGRGGDWLEKFWRRMQLAKINHSRGPRRPVGDTAVVVNDQMLKFHEEDGRAEYQREWQRKAAGWRKS